MLKISQIRPVLTYFGYYSFMVCLTFNVFKVFKYLAGQFSSLPPSNIVILFQNCLGYSCRVSLSILSLELDFSNYIKFSNEILVNIISNL